MSNEQDSKTNPVDSRRMPDFDDEAETPQQPSPQRPESERKAANWLGIAIGIIGLIVLVMIIHSAVGDFMQLHAISEADRSTSQPGD